MEAEWSIASTELETQIETNSIGFEIDDKTAIIHLSNAVDITTLNIVRLIKDMNATYADDLESLTDPIKDVTLMIWSTPVNELFQENLYFLFDKILDIVYCALEILDDVWHGAINIIESKLSQISQHILRIIDETKTLSESEHKIEFDKNISIVNETTIELTLSLVGLTSLITSIIHLITIKDISIADIVGSIASLQVIHQYTLSSVACLLSRAIQVLNSLSIVSATGIEFLEATLINYVLNLERIVLNSFPGATMTELFNGNLQFTLSKQLLISVKGFIRDKMFHLIQASTTSLFKFVQKYATTEFHVLLDLLDQLNAVLFQCGSTEFHKLKNFITYAFDGLLDVIHHISYGLDQNIKSSASTGTFQEPSEPIDMALTNVRNFTKEFISGAQHGGGSVKASLILNLVTSTKDLIKALLDPMNVIITKSNKSIDEHSLTIVSSLQFVALYVTGLMATPLQAPKNFVDNWITSDEIYLNFSAILSLTLIKVQLIFEYTKMKMDILKKLYKTFDDLFDDLSKEMNAIGRY